MLRSDAIKAHERLDWKPQVTFRTLARTMTDADSELAWREKLLHDADEEH